MIKRRGHDRGSMINGKSTQSADREVDVFDGVLGLFHEMFTFMEKIISWIHPVTQILQVYITFSNPLKIEALKEYMVCTSNKNN